MPRTRYTDAQRAEALAIYHDHGPAEASQRTGIPSGTIASWATRNGVATVAAANQGEAVAVAKITMAQRKLNLAAGLLDDAEKLRTQLFAPAVEKKALVISGGQNAPGSIEIAQVDLDEPTFGDKKAIMTAIAIAVDKIQLLTGEATSRHEEVSADERRRRLAERMDELATRREARAAS